MTYSGIMLCGMGFMEKRRKIEGFFMEICWVFIDYHVDYGDDEIRGLVYFVFFSFVMVWMEQKAVRNAFGLALAKCDLDIGNSKK